MQEEDQRLNVVFAETLQQVLDNAEEGLRCDAVEEEEMQEAIQDVLTFVTAWGFLMLEIELVPQLLHNFSEECSSVQSVQRRHKHTVDREESCHLLLLIRD